MTWEEGVKGGAAGGTAQLALGDGKGWVVDDVQPASIHTGGGPWSHTETTVSPQEHSLSWPLISRILKPHPEEQPGEVRAKLSREYGEEVRPPEMSTAHVTRREGLFVEKLTGEHGVIMNLPQYQDGDMLPPDLYANQVWRRNPPSEWAAQLARE